MTYDELLESLRARIEEVTGQNPIGFVIYGGNPPHPIGKIDFIPRFTPPQPQKVDNNGWTAADRQFLEDCGIKES